MVKPATLMREKKMRVNTKDSIATANAIHKSFGSWEAAKRSSVFKDGKFVVRSVNAGVVSAKDTANPTNR
jgi:hypothetical protein